MGPSARVVRVADAPARPRGDDARDGVIPPTRAWAAPGPPPGRASVAEVPEEGIAMAGADRLVVAADGEGGSAAIRGRLRAHPPRAEPAGTVDGADDEIRMPAVGGCGADGVLDDVAEAFGVDPE